MEIEKVVSLMKNEIESAVKTSMFNFKKYENGQKAKEALIRSSKLINYIHEWVKIELVMNGVNPALIHPPIGASGPELNIAGFLKLKDQDVCVVPTAVLPQPRIISWGPLANENIFDMLGHELSQNVLVINVRSQLSSIAKNTDTLFERTFAEALNLHIMYPKMVLAEIYMIPVYEYDDVAMIEGEVKFKKNKTNLEKYISFFDAISHRNDENDELYKYENTFLLITDFSIDPPIVYSSTQQLKDAGLLETDYKLNLENISQMEFISKLLKKYSERFDLINLKV